MSRKVLIIAAHSDDEALGCAGTIAKHISQGDEVHFLFMTDGVGSRLIRANEAKERLTTAQKVAGILGVKSFKNLNFPDNKMDSISLLDVVKQELLSNVVYDLLKRQPVFDRQFGSVQ
jgi:N-acetylglucosamine malate deacetylase 1